MALPSSQEELTDQIASQYHLIPAPVSSLTLQYFCACESTTVSYKTIKVYLAAILLNHIECGMTD